MRSAPVAAAIASEFPAGPCASISNNAFSGRSARRSGVLKAALLGFAGIVMGGVASFVAPTHAAPLSPPSLERYLDSDVQLVRRRRQRRVRVFLVPTPSDLRSDPGSPSQPPGFPQDARGRMDRLSAAPQLGARAPQAPGQLGLERLASACGKQAQELANWPIAQIERATRPTEAQRAMLNALRDAALSAANTLQAACPATAASAPTARLETVQKGLAAIGQAIDVLRPAVDQFYAGLDDEQKAQLIKLILQSGQEDASSAGRPWGLAWICEQPSLIGFTRWPVEQIRAAVQATEAQRAALQELWSTSNQATSALQTSCPADAPLSPPRRLEIMRKQLDAILDAVNAIYPALNRFYETLNGEQRARFNSL